MKNKIKTGVVGVGHLGQHHTKHYTKIKSAELVGVYDINEAQAKKIAKQFKTKAFSTLDEMLAWLMVYLSLHQQKSMQKLQKNVFLKANMFLLKSQLRKQLKKQIKLLLLQKKPK